MLSWLGLILFRTFLLELKELKWEGFNLPGFEAEAILMFMGAFIQFILPLSLIILFLRLSKTVGGLKLQTGIRYMRG